MSVRTTCRTCRREFEADRDAILAGAWRECPECRAKDVAIDIETEDESR